MSTDGHKVDRVIAETLGIDGGIITEQLAYGDVPEWDSLNHVELMLRLESEFGVEVGEDDMLELTSVRAIRQFVERRREP